jgi:TPR repeat protein
MGVLKTACVAAGVVWCFGCHRSRSDQQAAASASVIVIDPTFFACADPTVCAQHCDGGSPESCRKLAASYGFGQGVPKDETRATALYEHACDMKDAIACVFAGQMHEYGRGVDKDDAKAAKLYERACDQQWAPGCYNLAIMYERGTGVGADRVRAGQLYHAACKGGAYSACEKERGLGGD